MGLRTYEFLKRLARADPNNAREENRGGARSYGRHGHRYRRQFRTSTARPSFCRRPDLHHGFRAFPRLDQADGAHLRRKYPTIKSRPTRIANALEFVETNAAPSKSEILERLQGGDITAEDAIREMEALQ